MWRALFQGAWRADHRQGRQNGALRAWLERLEIDDAQGTHPDRADRKNDLATPEPAHPSRDLTRACVGRPRERGAPPKGSDIEYSRAADHRAAVPAAKRRTRISALPGRCRRACAEAPAGEPQAREVSTARAVRTGIAYLLASCGQLVDGFASPSRRTPKALI